MPTPRTLVAKIWDEHVVAELGGGYELLFVDRCYLHDLSGPISLRELKKRGLRLAHPELIYSMPDHLVSSKPGEQESGLAGHAKYIPVLREESAVQNFSFFDIDDDRQGIIHVVGPEQGITFHTSTHGGIGALAWGVGTSDLTHLLATGCLVDQKPKMMRITFEGSLPSGVTAKDMILSVIAQYGCKLGVGYAIEYAGQSVTEMSIESRLTLCNLSIELGARWGIVAPDDATFSYLQGRAFTPKEDDFDRAADYWRSLRSDDDASFDQEIVVDVSTLQSQITWGTNPSHTIGIKENIPHPEQAPDVEVGEGWRQALDYMGLEAGQPIEGTVINQVFIGSCTNGRLADLEEAAAVVRGQRVAPGVVAWVVPGSRRVKQAAEQRGLDKVFEAAGFEWREPSCSLCSAANGERVPPKWRCVSTSNRNYMGRQGPASRTHLASPQMAAAAAIAGKIVTIESTRALAQ